MDVRLGKYQKFDLEQTRWGHDTRMFETATKGMEVIVAKNFAKYALPCVAIYPDVDLKTGLYRGFKVAAPDGPLKSYFEQEDTKKIFFNLLRDATIDALAKKNEQKEGNDIGAKCSVMKTIAVTKPPRPIWVMNLKELETYFSNFKTELAKDEGVKLKTKWPKIENNIAVKLPTKLSIFDEVLEKILPSSVYVPYQKFPPGNKHWRLKLALDYLFKKKKLDSNTFAEEIPQDYEPKKFNIEKLLEFSDNVERSAEEHHNKKKKKDKQSNELDNVPFYLQDDGADYDGENSEEEYVEDEEEVLLNIENDAAPVEESEEQLSHNVEDQIFNSWANSISSSRPPSSTGPPRAPRPPGPTGSSSNSLPTTEVSSSSRTLPLQKSTLSQMRLPIGPISITMPVPTSVLHDLNDDDDIFNTSHTTGTPANSCNGASEKESVDGDNEELLGMLEEAIENTDNFVDLMKETDIRKLLSGEEPASQPVIQVFQFDKVPKAKCFRSHGHDGKVTTTKVTFSANITEKVELILHKMPLIKITNFVLYNGSFLFIKDFEVIKTFERKIADTDYLVEKEYEEFKQLSRPNAHLPQTPTMAIQKLSDKNVEKTNTLSTRSTSQRIQNRRHGSF